MLEAESRSEASAKFRIDSHHQPQTIWVRIQARSCGLNSTKVTHLHEANLLGVRSEALAAAVDAILPDEAVAVTAHAAVKRT